MSIWFTSDHHFGHANIIKYCNRPFSSISEMDECMIKRWNDVVHPDDIVYYLGDFCLRNVAYHVAVGSLLNGQKNVFVMGNHDSKSAINKLGYTEIIKYPKPHLFTLDGCNLALTHDPKTEIPANYYRIYGHVHNEPCDIPGTNVSVDVWDFYPVAWETIKDRIENQTREN